MMTQCSQSNPAGSWPLGQRASVSIASEPHRPMRLSIETVLVTIGTLAIIKTLHARQVSDLRWFLIPGVLVAAALVPTWIARRHFPRIGLKLDCVTLALRTVGRVCLFALPIAFLGQWIATRLHLPIPLQPVFAGRGDCLSWLLYQFFYVAVAEEVFFRGYIQANVMRLLSRWEAASATTQQWVGIIVSAACFALAHVVVQGQVVSLLTFLPGLLLAWLFVRTRSLLAPILFHGLANVAYGVMALTLA